VYINPFPPFRGTLDACPGVISVSWLTFFVSLTVNFPQFFIAGGVVTAPWQVVRRPYIDGAQAVTDVNSLAMRCHTAAVPAPQSLTVAAGSRIGFRVNPDIHHPGCLQFYMGIAPAGSRYWDGSGPYWFKLGAEPSISTGSYNYQGRSSNISLVVRMDEGKRTCY
jgi:hypothetical protein